MLISEADATWAADEFINYFGNFTSIEDYLRFVKRELVPKTNPLMSHEDEFFNEDISPEEMEFEIRFIGDRFPNSLPQDHYKNLQQQFHHTIMKVIYLVENYVGWYMKREHRRL